MDEQTIGTHSSTKRDGAAARLLVADGEPLFVSGVEAALEIDGGFEVVGSTSFGPQVLPLVGRLEPHVVLLNTRLPGLDGIDCLDRIMASYPRTKVIMCSATTEAALVEAAFQRGACGYIVKTIGAADLGAAIRQAINGTSLSALDRSPAAAEMSANTAGLTDRELEVMRAVTRGLSNEAVGKELWITAQTVKFHLTHAYRKLGVSNRTEAARWMISQGLEGRALESAKAA